MPPKRAREEELPGGFDLYAQKSARLMPDPSAQSLAFAHQQQQQQQQLGMVFPVGSQLSQSMNDFMSDLLQNPGPVQPTELGALDMALFSSSSAPAPAPAAGSSSSAAALQQPTQQQQRQAQMQQQLLQRQLEFQQQQQQLQGLSASSATSQIAHHAQQHQAPPQQATVPRVIKQQAQDASLAVPAFAPMEDVVRQFLARGLGDGGPEQTVVMLNSRVVQKSYGTEKRFFCPPPCVRLEGARWFDGSNGALRLFIGMGEKNCEFSKLDLEEGSVGTARALYISDSDKRKSFCLQLKIFFDNNRDVGTFSSKPIKVISKPSKKKQSLANVDMCVECGSEVALFNRVRSQAGSTKHMIGTPKGLVADTKKWSTFKITLADKPANPAEGVALRRPGRESRRFIHYGNNVILECTATGYQTPVVTVRKIEKSEATRAADDPLSQLQKVAFCLKDTNQYLTLSEGRVPFAPCKSSTDKGDKISDCATWTICSCDRAVYTFCETKNLVGPQATPVNPVPVVQYTKKLGPLVEVYGDSFDTRLTVWFDDVKAETFYRCEELLLARPPSFQDITHGRETVCRAPKTVSLLLVREDGVIYRTRHTFTYEVNQLALLSEVANAAAQAAHLSGYPPL